ncbi:MAG TPA: hypothetical protein VIO94_13500 [Phenylobacterium sp.]
MRRLVSELAQARPEDIEDVLGDLAQWQASRVRGLIAEYVGLSTQKAPSSAVTPPMGHGRPALDTSGLSPWLQARVEAALASGPADDGVLRTSDTVHPFRMTEAAMAALKRSALELLPAAAPPTAPDEPKRRRRGLFGGGVLG